jgi:hypothetical protein
MLTKIPPAYSKLVKGVNTCMYKNTLFPEWIKKELDKILSNLPLMGSPYV